MMHLRSLVRGAPAINVQPVSRPTAEKARVHLDLCVNNLQRAVDRVSELGGRSTGEVHIYDEATLLVMADPEGTEVCLVDGPGSPRPT
jgi:predicted enzyme related to lactoylglutathione lyase